MAGRESATAAAWLRCWAAAVRERRAWLTELDAAIGDGDHGINLERGLRAVVAELDSPAAGAADAGAIVGAAGRRIVAVAGGASGALYGQALVRAGEALSDRPRDDLVGDVARLGECALAAAIDAIVALGRAAPGDKTMLDALVPALDALRSAGPGLPPRDRLAMAAGHAAAGSASTIPMLARKGRASYLGERSIGHEDPGAASSALLVRCLADVALRIDR